MGNNPSIPINEQQFQNLFKQYKLEQQEHVKFGTDFFHKFQDLENKYSALNEQVISIINDNTSKDKELAKTLSDVSELRAIILSLQYRLDDKDEELKKISSSLSDLNSKLQLEAKQSKDEVNEIKGNIKFFVQVVDHKLDVLDITLDKLIHIKSIKK